MSDTQPQKNPSAFVAGLVARLKDSKRKLETRWNELVQSIALGRDVPDSEIVATMEAAQKTPEELQYDVEKAHRVEEARVVIQSRPQFERRQKECAAAVSANDARLQAQLKAAQEQHEAERLRLDAEQREITEGVEKIRLADVLLSAHDSDYANRTRLVGRIEHNQGRVNWLKDKLQQLEERRKTIEDRNSGGRVAVIDAEIDAFKEEIEAYAKSLVLDMDALNEPTGQPRVITLEDVAGRVERKRGELNRRREHLDVMESRAAGAVQRAASTGLSSDERESSQRVAASLRNLATAEKQTILALQKQILELESMLMVPAPG